MPPPNMPDTGNAKIVSNCHCQIFLFFLYRACFTHLISSNVSCNLCLWYCDQVVHFDKEINANVYRQNLWKYSSCIGQIEASTCPPPPGIPWAFDTFAVPGSREFDYQSLPGGGEFDPHALGVGNLNCTLVYM